jgi:hypothetical protein
LTVPGFSHNNDEAFSVSFMAMRFGLLWPRVIEKEFSMKQKILAVLLLAALLPATIFAATSGDPVKHYGFPFLITNAGQGPGGKMARLRAGGERSQGTAV